MVGEGGEGFGSDGEEPDAGAYRQGGVVVAAAVDVGARGGADREEYLVASELSCEDDGSAIRVGGELEVVGADEDVDLGPIGEGCAGVGNREGADVGVGAAVPEAAGQEVAGAGGPGDEGSCRGVVEVGRGIDLLQAASLQDGDAVGHREGLLPVVGDEDRGGAALVEYVGDLAPHLRLHPDVEVAERLVQEDRDGPGRECAGECDALLLAAGELVWVALLHAVEAYELEDALAAALSLGPGEAAEAELYVLGDGEVWEEGVLLEDDSDVAALGMGRDRGSRRRGCRRCVPRLRRRSRSRR